MLVNFGRYVAISGVSRWLTRANCHPEGPEAPKDLRVATSRSSDEPFRAVEPRRAKSSEIAPMRAGDPSVAALPRDDNSREEARRAGTARPIEAPP